MGIYEVKYYVDDKDQYDGRKSHNDIYESICDVEAETETKAISIAKEYLIADIIGNYYSAVDETGRMMCKLSYTVEENDDEILAYVEDYDDSFSCYYNFVAEEQ